MPSGPDEKLPSTVPLGFVTLKIALSSGAFVPSSTFTILKAVCSFDTSGAAAALSRSASELAALRDNLLTQGNNPQQDR